MEAQKSDRLALSRDLSEFLVELSIALHRHSMYPTGHPALDPAIEAVVRRAERLLQDRASIAFGVARRQLVIEGVTTDPNQPVLRRLAEGLHRRHVGAITLMRGVASNEIGEALRALAVEGERDASVSRESLPNWPHLKLHPISFDGLALSGDALQDTDAESPEVSGGADLWVGLARAALSFDDVDESDDNAAEPSVVARAINERSRGAAYDQVIVGYLLQIAHELKTSSGEKAEELRRRTSRLIASLRPDTLRRLVDMGGDAGQRGKFVRDATLSLAVDAVLEIVKAAGEASGQTISHGLVRMLAKLAMQAELGSELARPRADIELREQVGRLLEDWRLEDPTPEEYGHVLQYLATAEQDAPAMAGVAAPPDPVRIVQMSLESGAFGSLAEKAVDDAIQAGQLTALLGLLTSLPNGADAGLILARLTHPETLRKLLARERVDLTGLDQLLPSLPLEAYEPLLDAVGSSPNRAVRRKLLELLSRTAADIGPRILARLDDERWYVQRNMLMLLARSGRVPEGFSVVRWASHPDARVRSEAIRLQLLLPQERDLGIEVALNDDDPRIVHLGVTVVRDDCPAHVLDRLIELAVEPESDEEVRRAAVTALGRLPYAVVLEALLHLADGGRSWLRRPRLPPKTPVLLAVLRALAEHWSDDPRAAAVLAAAWRSSDPDLREASSPPATT